MLSYKGYSAVKKNKEWFIYSTGNYTYYVIWLAGGTQREVKQAIDNYINK